MDFRGVVYQDFDEVPWVAVDERRVVYVIHQVFQDEMLRLVNGPRNRALILGLVLNGDFEELVYFED